MNSGWPNAVARRLGLGGSVDFTTTRVGQTLHIPCRGQGRHRPHVVDVTISPGQHPDAVAKKLLNDGWTIGRRLMCPNTHKKRKERAMPENQNEAPIVTPTPSPAAGRARRLVYMALEEYYDEARKNYRPGRSDASIAKECGVSETLVRTIREESYGPLATPSELAAVLAQVEEFKRQAAAQYEAHKETALELEKKIDEIVRKNGWSRAASTVAAMAPAAHA